MAVPQWCSTEIFGRHRGTRNSVIKDVVDQLVVFLVRKGQRFESFRNNVIQNLDCQETHKTLIPILPMSGIAKNLGHLKVPRSLSFDVRAIVGVADGG